MKTFLFILILILNAFKLSSQTKTDELFIAEDHFKNESYSEAIPHLLKLLDKDSLNPSINFKTGVCYLNSRSQKGKATKYLQRAVLPYTKTYLPINAYELLGDSYHHNQQFDLAVAAYEEFKLMLLSKDHTYAELLERAKWKIEMCTISKTIAEVSDSQKYKTAFSKDQSQLSFTFFNDQETAEDKYFKAHYKTMPYLEMHLSPDDSLTKTIQNEATIATSQDAQHILQYRNDEGSFNLYLSSLKENNWSTPQKVDKKINDSGWEAGECISADNNTLYFISGRSGGYGGTDIYKCERNSFGEWGKAINLGPTINSPYDEEAPFIHPAGNVLYFSSNKITKNSLFDIFTTNCLQDETWSEPKKIGYPAKMIESENDNTQLLATAQKSNGFILFKDAQENNLYLVTGIATGPKGKNPNTIKITATDNKTGEIFGRYNTKDIFSFIIPGNKENNITYDAAGYLYFSESIDLTQNKSQIRSKKIREFTLFVPGSVMELNNIFFRNDKAELLQNSGSELNKLIELLTTNQALTIELSGYINSDENKKYNAHLSQERIKLIKDYLLSRNVNEDQIVIKTGSRSPKRSSKNTSTEKEQTAMGEQKIELKILEINPKKNNSITTQ